LLQPSARLVSNVSSCGRRGYVRAVPCIRAYRGSRRKQHFAYNSNGKSINFRVSIAASTAARRTLPGDASARVAEFDGTPEGSYVTQLKR
jgi:hypothetical protein